MYMYIGVYTFHGVIPNKYDVKTSLILSPKKNKTICTFKAVCTIIHTCVTVPTHINTHTHIRTPSQKHTSMHME